VVYLRETGWEPDKSWGGFVKQALRDEYTFDYDDRYQAWLSARLRGYRLPVHVDARRLTGASLARYGAPPRSDDAAAALAMGGAAEAGPQPHGHVAPAEVETFEDTPWGRARARLATELPAAIYQTWIKPLAARLDESPDGLRLTLQAPDAFAADWVRQKHAPLIAAVVGEEAGRPVAVDVDVARVAVVVARSVGA
jgi:hypothetical protein